MAENKTQPTDADVGAYLAGIEHDTRRADSLRLCEMLRGITGEEPVMWGASMVGFGSYDYRYASGREGSWFRVGFAPRKDRLTVYFMDGFDGQADLLQRLGPHTNGKSCLHVTRLARIDSDVLEEMLRRSWAQPAMGEVTD